MAGGAQRPRMRHVTQALADDALDRVNANALGRHIAGRRGARAAPRLHLHPPRAPQSEEGARAHEHFSGALRLIHLAAPK
jgi:hypothetical protein